MAQQPTGVVFTLTITGTEHGEWQGVLRAGGKERPFRSVLELLKEIQKEMEQKKSCMQASGSKGC
jgi:6-phosphogluconate dehydrogenase